MTTKWLVSVASLAFAAVLLPSSALAHPAWDPYDDTQFAPIERFGPSIGVEVVAEGLTAPLKGVTAPGQPNRLYVVDQVGILWAVDLTTKIKSAFLNVGPTGLDRIIELGVCGPDTFDERGLLGVAFHPNYPQNGLLYTYTSEPAGPPATLPTELGGATPDHQNVVAEWRVPNPGNPASVVDPASRRELMRVSWPQFNHDGGDMAFGPDGKLYISMGDGGGADDADGQDFVLARPTFQQQMPDCSVVAPITGHQGDGNAQKLNVPLGKILRIDVNPPFTAGKQYRVPADNPFFGKEPQALGEIWAYGFRNPFRFSFDSRSGALYVGDVGQNDIEEVDVVVRGGNYGWNFKEGTLFFHINGTNVGTASRQPDPARMIPPGLIDPIAQYDTHHEGHSVIGGFVYRGHAIKELRGEYVFGDFALVFKFPRGPHDYGRLFAFDPDGKGSKKRLRQISQLLVVPGGALSLALLGWGQDAHGELYALGNVFGVPFPDATGPTGHVLKLVPAPETDDGKDDRKDDRKHDD
jgi:glucose/arabinose dehydrogenase